MRGSSATTASLLAVEQVDVRDRRRRADDRADQGSSRLWRVPRVPAVQQPALLAEPAAVQDPAGRLRDEPGGVGYYVAISASGLTAGAGYYEMDIEQLERFRQSVHDERSGREIETIEGDLVATGYWVGGRSELKSAPRGFAKDHPRIGLLRRRGLMMSKDWAVDPWLHTAAVEARVRVAWAAALRLCTWLDQHVGRSTGHTS